MPCNAKAVLAGPLGSSDELRYCTADLPMEPVSVATRARFEEVY